MAIYRINGTLTNGAATDPDPDGVGIRVNIDRTPTGLHHYNIDDDETVLDLLETHFKDNVER